MIGVPAQFEPVLVRGLLSRGGSLTLTAPAP